MSTILLVGRWDPPYLTFARSCKHQKVDVHFLQIGPPHGRWRCYTSCLAGGAVIDSDRVGGIRQMLDYARAVRAEGIVSIYEPRLLWLAQHRSMFEPDCKLLAPPLETLELLSSKCRQARLAAEIGFHLLPTFHISGAADCGGVPSECYPVVVRPDDKWKLAEPFKFDLLRSAGELRKFAERLSGGRSLLVAQPFLNLPNLLVHGARTEDGKILTMQAFLVPRKFQGSTLTITPSEFPPGVEQCCRDFADACGVTGCFHYELLYSPRRKRAWFLELNGRLGGTTDKVTALGFDESHYLLSAFGFLPPPAPRPLRRRMGANKGVLLKHLVWGLGGRLTVLDYPGPNLASQGTRALWDIVAAKDSVFDWRDLRGSLWMALGPKYRHISQDLLPGVARDWKIPLAPPLATRNQGKGPS